jgi:NADP-dependent 3-hydroxy acid dehydrogenase YdfG
MADANYATALVTGASSGIGRAIVRELSDQGLAVTALARRRDRLETLAKETGCAIATVDVRDTAALREVVVSQPFDVVVNNAGVMRGFEALHKANPDDIDAAFATNVTAAYHLLNAVLPGMIERRRGHLFHIGSMAGLYALKSSVYGGTKGAVHMLARNVRLELEGTGVRSTEICPGRVRTELYDVAIDDPIVRDQHKLSGIEELQPEDIAQALGYALRAPWRVNVNLIELQPVEQTYGGAQFVSAT